MDTTPVVVPVPATLSAAEKLAKLRQVEAKTVSIEDALRSQINSLKIDNENLNGRLLLALKKGKKKAKKLKKTKKAFNKLVALFKATLASIELLLHYDWEHTFAVLSDENKHSIKEYTGENGTLLYPSADNLDENKCRNTNNWANLYVIDNWNGIYQKIRDLRQKIK